VNTDESGDAIVMRAGEVRIGHRTIWHDVSLSIRHGEFVAVLGPNGAGKSTLLKTLLGLVELSAGSLQVLGGAVGSHNDAIGYLPQRRSFDASVRVRGIDIVRMGVDGGRWGLARPVWLGGTAARAARARVAEVIDLVGATAYADRPIGQCSGGEQQRLLIAQALAPRPRLLLLDEPLDSLDVTNQASVSALLQDVCRELGIAVVLVAHDVNPILSYLDRVVYVAHGGIVAGTPAEVINADTLSALYGTTIDVLFDRAGRMVVVGQPDIHPDHGGHHH
jgi:zinc/manganese transport system ATP-binding protein